jgi:hypothetical protein
MKRSARDIRNKCVRSVKPWFTWLFCEMCRDEFKREKGWSYSEYIGGEHRTPLMHYVCASCCPTKDDAYAWFNGTRSPPQSGSVLMAQ